MIGLEPPVAQDPHSAARPLRVVLVEDSPAEAERLIRELRKSGLDCRFRHVDSEPAFLEALEPLPDLVIAAYQLASFSGRRALEILRSRDADVPFIVTSATIGDELAAGMVRMGANDYLPKDRLNRLGEAVTQALEERELRRRQRQSEAALVESEARFRRLAENAPDMIFTFRPHPGSGSALGTFEYVSPAALAITGHPPEHFYRDPGLALRLPHPEDLMRQLEAWSRGTDGRPVALRWIRRDGDLIWVEQRNIAIVDPDGSVGAVEGILRDITERKAAEASSAELLESLQTTEAQRRRLLARLVTAQEEEAARIAGDIHDDSIQTMAAVSLRLGLLARRLREPAQLEVLNGLQEAVEISISRLRHLMFDLRPVGIGDGGLATVLRDRLDRSRSETGLDFEVQDRVDHMRGDPPADLQIIAFRIAQEALANVRKHARASKVLVSLDSIDDGLRLRVVDDGVGFAPGDAARSPLGHLGLTAMQERAEAAGGWCRIQGRRGEGTTVECWLPLPRGPSSVPGSLAP